MNTIIMQLRTFRARINLQAGFNYCRIRRWFHTLLDLLILRMEHISFIDKVMKDSRKGGYGKITGRGLS